MAEKVRIPDPFRDMKRRVTALETENTALKARLAELDPYIELKRAYTAELDTLRAEIKRLQATGMEAAIGDWN